MPVEKYSISLHPDIAEAVKRRQDVGGEGYDRSTVINRALGRYFEVVEVGRRRLAELLSDEEIGLVLDVFNGTLFSEPFSIQMVPVEVADSLADHYDEKWQVDGPALVEKLRGLSYAEHVALVDCVERWWNRVAAGEDRLKPGEALRPTRG